MLASNEYPFKSGISQLKQCNNYINSCRVTRTHDGGGGETQNNNTNHNNNNNNNKNTIFQ